MSEELMFIFPLLAFVLGPIWIPLTGVGIGMMVDRVRERRAAADATPAVATRKVQRPLAQAVTQ